MGEWRIVTFQYHKVQYYFLFLLGQKDLSGHLKGHLKGHLLGHFTNLSIFVVLSREIFFENSNSIPKKMKF